ncbi:hypothetical protein JKP88DRAFT_235950 [Tribonema minus]|uniref:Ribosomal protein/NADH dehydrogenase domain-containing protein n=1 Tax=Tribonema minus TaxID=303371 RepID=A0A835Z469_9STRA|nr:hypothetical protein JKP88DRAFT_235950 [Tribonema minus]|eukprot:TRINITY_DN2063_c0_g1_i2.p1 TRINITY_DN2063_c0_g1~~TRINITY_DN2063_c0_g1_i2.p1  ORF type:complete len:130 (-),score=16.77 TRINITY_DN2063_c0_g1_i2:92-439(-)
MPRFRREQAIHLFKYVREVNVKMNPWAGDLNRGALEFLRRMGSPAHLKANPKVKIDSQFVLEPTWPKIHVKFVDNSKLEWEAHRQPCQEVVEAYLLHAQEIESQFEMEDKNIDEM